MNNIANFYKNENIFVTGATGFLGKGLLEKLLRSCAPKKIYVLIREKRGLSPAERLETISSNPVFDELRKEGNDYFKKVKVIYGDISQENLGLDELDRNLIIEEVNIVFHLAATVRLNGELLETLKINTLGTQQIAQLCTSIKNLKSFVYVSTAYSTANLKQVDEIVYEPPYDPSAIINCVSTPPPEFLREIEHKLIKYHPNPYTFSKSLAENVIAGYSKTLPVAIVRPSNVNGSWKKPFPGWVDIASAGMPLIIQFYVGTVHSFFACENLMFDTIPVDFVINTIIAAAWNTVACRSDKMRIYNCTSSNLNSITMKAYLDLVTEYSRAFPTQYVFFYPKYKYCINSTIYEMRCFVFKYTIALFIDTFLYFTKQKPRLMRLYNKIYESILQYQWVLSKEILFKTTTFQSLIEAVEKAEDGDEFSIDIIKGGDFDWSEYIKDVMVGVHQHILKDDLSSMDRARTKVKRLLWISYAIKILIGVFCMIFLFIF